MFFGALGNSGKLLPHIFAQDSVVLDEAYGLQCSVRGLARSL